jgi:hypothetical protein
MEGAEIYGVKIPVPRFREIYSNQENEHYYLAIEHYFEDDLLEKFGLIKETGIPNIFKIKNTKSLKSKFAKHIRSIDNPEVFKNFIPLFETIDEIANMSIEYYSDI